MIHEFYKKEITKNYKKLTRDDEAKLCERIKNGDQQAEKELVCSVLPFAYRVATKYQGKGVSLDDLIGAAQLGLILAARRFKSDRRTKFPCYAVWWVRREILKEIAKMGRPVAMSADTNDTIKRARDAFNNLKKNGSNDPSYYEVAKSIGSSEDLAKDLLAVKDTHISIDSNEDGIPVNDNFYLKIKAKLLVEKLLKTLSIRDQFIIRKRFGLLDGVEYTYECIGECIGSSRQNIRELEMRAINKLRKLLPKIQVAY